MTDPTPPPHRPTAADRPDDDPAAATDRPAAAADRPAAAADGPAAVRPVDLRDYVEFERGEATRVRVFQTAQLALDVWCVEPRGSTGALHLADQDVAYTVIAGRSWFVTDDGEVGLDPMGAMLVPADVVHGFENRSPDPLIVHAVCSPPGTGVVAAPVELAEAAVHLPADRPSALRRAVSTLLGTSERGPR